MAPQKRDEWTPLYTAEFLIDRKVCQLPLAAQGLLVRVWCVIHQHGSIPTDPAKAAKLLNNDPRTVRSLWPMIRPFLIDHPSIKGDSTSNRLLKEAELAAQFRKRAQLGASITNGKRWGEAKSGSSPSDSHSGRLPVSVSIDGKEKENLKEGKEKGAREKKQEPHLQPGLLGSMVQLEAGVHGAKRGRMGGALVELSNLHPSNRPHFDRVDQAWLPRSDGRPSRGNKQAAEALFQTIVDRGVLDGQKVTAEELESCATLIYLREHPNALAGVVMMLKTFYALDAGEWKNCLRILRERRFTGDMAKPEVASA